ncbi:MAG: hypothetical protein ABI947_23075 [Chloroflexota bacterium]
MLFDKFEQVADPPAFAVQARQIIRDQGHHIWITQAGFQSQPPRAILFMPTRFMTIHILIPFREPAVRLARGQDIGALAFRAIFIANRRRLVILI